AWRSTSWNSCCMFFFSSRRRHTRCYRDWSSDVCSSDLRRNDAALDVYVGGIDRPAPVRTHSLWFERRQLSRHDVFLWRPQGKSRSEERRVGKESRSRFMRPQPKERKTKGIRST